MQAHPAAELFPLMQGKEFDELVADIREHGQRTPIVTYQNQVLDGRNRLRACEEIGAVPITTEWDGQGSAVALVISLNAKRRHLTASQLAVVAAQAVPMFEEENRKKQAEGRKEGGRVAGNGRRKLLEGCSAPQAKDESARSTAQAAKATGAGTKATKVATSIMKNASDVFDALKDGTIATIAEAAAVAKLPPEQRAEAINAVRSGEEKSARKAAKAAKRRAAAKAAPTSDACGTVDVGDVESLRGRIAADSIDLIFTDPPYHDECLDLYERLAELAAHALKPGALCLVYAGKMYLPDIAARMSEHLKYHWQFIVFHAFSTARSNSRAVFENYRPILAFRKAGQLPHASEQPWVQDVVRGRREKDHHDWQQDEDAPRYYIDAYTRPGDLILDPFSGGGTTAAVCKAIGRRFAAYDADEECVKITLGRLAKIKGAA